MASHSDYVEYVVEQLRGAGNVRARKMFGEYGLLCDGASDSFVIEDVEDPTMAVELTCITCEALRKAASQKRRK